LEHELEMNGADVMTMSPEAFADYVRDEQLKWARVVQASGARLDLN
jgi:hypothetical protein